MKYSKKLLSLSLIVVLALAPFVSANAAPPTNEELDAIYSDTVWYVPNAPESAGSCSTATTLTGSETTQQIYNFLIAKGLTPPQAAGIMGNLQAESGMNPRRVQNTSSPSGDRDDMVIGTSVGYGLAQWTSEGRQRGLRAAAAAAGKKDSDLAVQLDFLWKEMNDPGQFLRGGFARLKATSDVRQAASIFMLEFERPADQSQRKQDQRGAMALDWLNKYGTGAGSATPAQSSDSTVSACESGGAVVNGSFSLPLDKKFYDANPDSFRAPHNVFPASDIPVPNGSKVYSITDGVILEAPTTTDADCGRGVLIAADDGVQYIYCHGPDGGSVPGAMKGDRVKAGQLIMHTGETGTTTGPHLHVAIAVKGQTRCPQSLFIGIVEGTPPDPKSLPASGCVGEG